MAVVKNIKLYTKHDVVSPTVTPIPTFIYDEEIGVELSKIADEINLNIGTYKYYVDLVGWKYLGIFITLYNNVIAKIYVSGQFDKFPEDCDYIDLTQYLMDVEFLESNQNHLLNLDTPFPFRWIKIEVIVSNILNKFGIWLQKIS
jgi:hypothetical protein